MALVDKAPSVFAAVLILACLACIVYPLRVYVRLTKKAWGYDDWCLSVGFVFFIALTSVCLGGPFHGVGVHQRRLSDEDQTKGRLWFFLFEVFFCIDIILVKVGIALMLTRIADPMRPYVWALWTAASLVTVANLVALFYIIFQCSPVEHFWDTSTRGHCNPSQYLANVYYADTAVNILVDWFCALLPIPLLWNIEMNRNTKISLGFLLGLGVFASISACIRLKYTVNLNKTDDLLYSVGDIVIWGYAENATGVIVASISTLKPLFSRLFKLGSSAEHSSHELSETKNGPPRLGSAHGGNHLPERSRNISGKPSVLIRSEVRRNSSLSLCESEEELVQNREKGIRVQRSVTQHRDSATKI